MVNGRLEKTRVVLYFSSSRANSASPPAIPSSTSVMLEDAPEDLEEELDVILATEAEVYCLVRTSPFDASTVKVSSRLGTFVPGITLEGVRGLRNGKGSATSCQACSSGSTGESGGWWGPEEGYCWSTRSSTRCCAESEFLCQMHYHGTYDQRSVDTTTIRPNLRDYNIYPLGSLVGTLRTFEPILSADFLEDICFSLQTGFPDSACDFSLPFISAAASLGAVYPYTQYIKQVHAAVSHVPCTLVLFPTA
ncbi:hypothetical protein BGX38DRAFT_1197053, partial [Terfezia claveryi]